MRKRLGSVIMISFAFGAGMAVTLVALVAFLTLRSPGLMDLKPTQVSSNTDGSAGLNFQAAPPTNTRRAPSQAGNVQAGQANTNPTLTATGPGTQVAQAATETIPPYTGLPSLTPSRTLRPPPTLEPPTPTSPATSTPTITPTVTFEAAVSIPGLRGGELPTPTDEVGCTPRKDWKLEYEVKRDDALSRIADMYNTNVDDLVAGNCLTNKNLIVIGQHLKVPGKVQPVQPEVVCVAVEMLTPRNGTLDIPGGGNISFVWHGPRASYNLIRIKDSNGNVVYEDVVELRQNESIDIGKALPNGGTYTWYVYPLNSSFVQVCPEGGPYVFTKDIAPTATPAAAAGR